MMKPIPHVTVKVHDGDYERERREREQLLNLINWSTSDNDLCISLNWIIDMLA